MELKRVNQQFVLMYEGDEYYFNAESAIMDVWYGSDKKIVETYNNENPDNLIDTDNIEFNSDGNVPPENDSIYLQEDFIFTFDDGSTSFISLTDDNGFSMDKYYPGEEGEASQFNPLTYFPELVSLFILTPILFN